MVHKNENCEVDPTTTQWVELSKRFRLALKGLPVKKEILAQYNIIGIHKVLDDWGKIVS